MATLVLKSGKKMVLSWNRGSHYWYVPDDICVQFQGEKLNYWYPTIRNSSDPPFKLVLDNGEFILNKQPPSQ